MITFFCTGCGGNLEAPDNLSGKSMGCEHCGKEVVAPKILPKMPPTVIEAFYCMHCGYKIEGLSLDYYGLQYQCPSCEMVIDVPEIGNTNKQRPADIQNIPISNRPPKTISQPLPNLRMPSLAGAHNKRQQTKPHDNKAEIIKHLGSMVSFKGRITQTHYLFCTGISVLILLAILCVAFLLGSIFDYDVATWLCLPFLLFLKVFTLSFHARRLHDAGASGALVLISFVPIFGWLVLFLVCALQPSESGPNAYGDGPHKLFGMR